tara:strand:+ start:401 stop:1207 length:807 start_codon:yes stop_codon:yes gene_type:complete
MRLVRSYIRNILSENVQVRGYVKPVKAFKTLKEWEHIARILLMYQRSGISVRNKTIPGPIYDIIQQHFGYLLYDEVSNFESFNTENVLIFIEDFINHRVWSIKRQYAAYFKDIDTLRFAYFYSRGDIEPYVLMNSEFTHQIYGSVKNLKVVSHFTNQEGMNRIQYSIEKQEPIDISAFTYMMDSYFDEKANIKLKLIGNVKAAFKSDIKSVVVDNGMRACNMLRLDYPGDETNICYDLNECDQPNQTSLWNEYIVTPIKILDASTVNG